MTTSNESKTPETDAAAFHDDGHDPESFVVSYDFAAGLEIERNALRAKLAAPVDGLPEGCPTTIQWCPVCKRLGGHWSFHQDGGMVTLELAPVGARDRLAALEGVNPPKGAAKDSTLGHAS